MRTWADIFQALDNTNMYYEFQFDVDNAMAWEAKLTVKHGQWDHAGTVFEGEGSSAKEAARNAAALAVANYRG